MNTYRITIKILAETKAQAEQRIGFRVPDGKICTVRKDNGKSKGGQYGTTTNNNVTLLPRSSNHY